MKTKGQPRTKSGRFAEKYTPEIENKIQKYLIDEVPVERMILLIRMYLGAKTDITAYRWIERAALKLGIAFTDK